MPKSTKLIVIILVLFACVFVFMGISQKIFPGASTIIFHHNAQLAQTNGITNFLILGIGGANHDGPNLTDTIIFASVNYRKNTVNLVSVPRDLWVNDVGQNGGKINEAYADGELDNQHKGLAIAKAIIGKVFGQPIHYSARIDFQGFVKAVDLAGGIDVNVQNTLDDYQYPIEGKEDDACGHTADEIKQYTDTFSATGSSDLVFFPCRYMHLHVGKGMQHMDGTLALEFVRSRHAAGSEGSDFARSRRQQLIIEAFRAKLLSLGFLFDPKKLIGMYNIVKDSIDTDIPQADIAPFITVLQKVKNAKIVTSVLDYGNSLTGRPGLLIQPPISSQYDYEFVLIPRIGNENFSEIQSFVSCQLTKGNCRVKSR